MFAIAVKSRSIFFMYSLTGVIAAFLQSSLRSDPDSPSVRRASSSKGKPSSNSVSLSICATTMFGQDRLVKRRVGNANQCQDSLALGSVGEANGEPFGHPTEDGSVDVIRPVGCTEYNYSFPA
jgi:hypothetical protein